MINSMLAELAGHKGFVCYRLARNAKGGTDKIPFDPATGYNSDAQNPATWLTPADAEAGAARWATTYTEGTGVGIVIYEGSGLFCIDLDHCFDSQGNLSPIATDVIARFPGAPVEISQSTEGLHVFGGHDGKLKNHKTKNIALHIELYTAARFIALTGNFLIPGKLLMDHSAALSALAAEYFPRETAEGSRHEWKSGPSPGWNFFTDDEQLIAYAIAHKSPAQQLGGRCPFKAMWEADGETLGKFYPPNPTSSTPYDASSVDQAFANHLAWLTGNDCDRVLSIMERSALKRPKWERVEYLHGTIAEACASPKKWPRLPKGKLPSGAAVNSAQSVKETVVPEVPTEMPPPPGAPERGGTFFMHDQVKHFEHWVYVEDICQALSPEGNLLDAKRFDIREPFAGRQFQMRLDGTGATDSAWKAFTGGPMPHTKVRGLVFDPRETPRAIVKREGQDFINTYAPLDIPSYPGDVSLFLGHINKLLPQQTHRQDAEILLSYLKFMVQHKGHKAAWFPFIQGAEGNGKSLINHIMEYCMGSRYTHKPRPAELDSRFNSKFYACLFVALDDMQVSDAKPLWERLKPMVSETSMEIESKGVDAVVREVCFNIIATSNYKNGVPITESGRRIAPFFCAQQSKRDILRDGMDSHYFTKLWSMDLAPVLHWLQTTPINPLWNPAVSATVAPVTSSTLSGINETLGAMEQEVLEMISIGAEGFAGGWISGAAFDTLVDRMSRAAVSRNRRRDMLISLGYVAHPGLPDGGRVCVPLPDGTRPRLYIKDGHKDAGLTEPVAIRAAFLAAQPKPTL